MSQARPRKPPDKNGRAAHRARQQKVMESMIGELDRLAAQADLAELGTASRILYTAKEELVHWAVTMNFHESARERFINGRLYGSSLPAVEALIMRAIENARRKTAGSAPPLRAKTKTASLAARK